MGFIDDIQKTTLCGDGALHPLLVKNKVEFPQGMEELCIRNPDRIADIHREYLAAGARVIRTNSLHANDIRLLQHGLDRHVNEINWQSVQIAKQAVRGTNAYVAGNVGPLGISEADAKQQGINRRAVFQEQIGALLDGGVNLVLFEGFTDIEELLLALYVKQSLHHCPAVCTFAFQTGEHPLAGISVTEAFSKLYDGGAEVVGITGVSHWETIDSLTEELPPDLLLAAYINPGIAIPQDILKRRVCLIGGGNGTTPPDIQRIAKALEPEKPQ